MADLRKYWQDLRAIEKSLPEYVWLTSHGGMVQAGAAVAAKLLYAKSHRLATEDETEEHLALQQDIRRRQFQQRLRDQGIAVVPIER
jgi:hypothetical protein